MQGRHYQTGKLKRPTGPFKTDFRRSTVPANDRPDKMNEPEDTKDKTDRTTADQVKLEEVDGPIPTCFKTTTGQGFHKLTGQAKKN